MAIEARGHRRVACRIGSWIVAFGSVLALAGAPLEAAAFSLFNGDVGWDGPGLGSAELGWFIVNGTSDLANEREILELALEEWASVAQLTFTPVDRVSLPNAIDFDFTYRRGLPHGFNSDGPLGFKTYTFFPDDVNYEPVAGDITFDEAETWTWAGGPGAGPGTCTTTSCDLYALALRAIGQALGLSQPPGSNPDAPAVMDGDFSLDRRLGERFGIHGTLSQDDVDGIRAIYAAREHPVPIPEPAAGLLVVAGLGALVVLRRRRT